MKKSSLFIFFASIFLSLLVSSCSNLETAKTTSINIRIPVKNIVENNSEQSLARAVISESDTIYELKITLNVDGQDIIQNAQGTPEALSNKFFSFNDLQVGALATISCDILKNDALIWTGQSESITVSEGTNNVRIKMNRVQGTITGTIEPDYPELSLILMSSTGEILAETDGVYQVAPMQKIILAVKDSSNNDVEIKSSKIMLYQNGDEVPVKSTSDKAIFIPHDAVGSGYMLRITVTTRDNVSYDKMVSIDIVEDLKIPVSDKREYESL